MAGCNCGCHCEENHCEEENKKLMLFRLIFGALLFLTAFFTNQNVIFFIAYAVLGYDVVFGAVKSIRNIFNEKLLMTIASVGAFILGEFPEACAVMLFYQLGEFLSDYAVDKSKKSIGELMDLRADTAHICRENGFETVHPKDVHIGDTVRVLSGEKIPLDGIISKGTGYFDTKSLTGESVPKKLSEGDTVLSGYILRDSMVEFTVAKEYSDSTASKILELVKDEKKAKSEKFITRFARIYTPIVVLLALLIAVIPPVFGGDYEMWCYRAILFLVVSCPCALVVSVPLSFFAGIGGASVKGILIKGAFALEKAADIENIAFDKTGTLTDGQFEVREISSEKYSNEKLLEYAAFSEFYSSHPVARAIVRKYGKSIDENAVSEFKELSGKGVSATVNSHKVAVGSAEFIGAEQETKSCVYVGIDGEFAGTILVSDKLKDEAQQAVLSLKLMNISPCILTGDSAENTKPVSDVLEIPYISSLLPQDKVSEIENIKKSGVTAFVGDGINDAPVLSNADLGISMGGIGSDAAIYASDVVLTSDNLEKLPKLIKISRKTMRIVRENIVISIAVKIGVMLLGAVGSASIWLAVFADVGVLILAVLNSLRAFAVKD